MLVRSARRRKSILFIVIFVLVSLSHVTLLYPAYRKNLLHSFLDSHTFPSSDSSQITQTYLSLYYSSSFSDNNYVDDDIESTMAKNITETSVFSGLSYIWHQVLMIGLLVWTCIFWIPLIHIYLYGPSMNGWLFWQSKSAQEICTILSNNSVNALFWLQNQEQCLYLIFQHLEGFLSSIHLLFSIFMYSFLIYLIYSDWIYQSMFKQFESMFDYQHNATNNLTMKRRKIQ